MTRRRFLPVLLCLLLPAQARGQDPQAPSKAAQKGQTITVRAVGAFLGQAEGFCENPGGTYDDQKFQDKLKPCLKNNSRPRSIGGAIGAADKIAWLQRSEIASDVTYIVVAPNNYPVGQSGSALDDAITRMKPAAIGIGSEDVDRLTRGRNGSAFAIVDWIGKARLLPFLASNLSIREHRHKLNSIKNGGFELHVPRDESIPWTEAITLETGGEVPEVDLAEMTSCDPAVKAPVASRLQPKEKKPIGKDVRLDISGYLRPGSCYRMHVTGSRRSGDLSFHTDEALTPRHSDLDSMNRVPAIVDPRTGIVITDLVDPSAKDRAVDDVWKFKDAAADKEMIFVDPLKVTKWLLLRARRAAMPPPSLLVLSDLSDERSLKVLEQIPEVRVMVLHPDSSLLGRAAEPIANDDPKKRYSGDLGFGSLVDAQYAVATRLLLRPEWFGETVVSATAALSHDSNKKTLLTNSRLKVSVVRGAELNMVLEGDDVVYKAQLDAGSERELGKFHSYTGCAGSTIDRCVQFSNLWSSVESVAAVVGDAARRQLHTDLAAIPSAVVDPDFRSWVAAEIADANAANWLSRYMLERLLYRSPRIVRAYIPGSDLPGVLVKIAGKDGEDYCISGLGSPCPPPVDKAHPSKVTVNDRRINPRLIYSIAAPEALAEELELDHSHGKRVSDLVEATNDHLKDGDWYVTGAPGSTMSARAEGRLNRRVDGYWTMTSLDLGLGRVILNDPGDNGSAVRANLPIPFAGTKASKTMTVNIDSDLAVVDLPRWAVRFPMTLDYKRTEQGDSVSYDPDEFSMGGQVDRKVPILGDTRFFVGAFVDGALRDHQEDITASREISSTDTLVVRESAKFSTSYPVEPSRYRHVAVGGELRGVSDFNTGPVNFKVAKLGLQWTYGHETRAPYQVAIAGEPQDVADYFTLGAQKLLGKYFAAHQDTFSSQTRFELLTRTQQQQRPEVNAEGTISYKKGTRTFTGDIDVRLRWYVYGGKAPSDFSLTTTQKLDFKFAIPLVWRLKVVPHYQYQRAAIAADLNNTFSLHMFDVAASLPFVVRWGHGMFMK